MAVSTLTSLVGSTYPMTDYALGAAMSSCTDQLASLQAEKEAIEDVESQILASINPRIASQATTEGGYLYKFNGYGITNVRDWQIEFITAHSLPGLTGGSGFFTCVGNWSTWYNEGTPFYVKVSSTKRCISTSSVYDVDTNTTTVYASGITTALTVVYQISSVHASSYYDNNTYPDIKKWMHDYDFAYDHLTCPLSSGATYGIQPRIDMITSGSAIITTNKEKQDEMDSIYRPYTQWKQLVTVSAGTLSYVDETTFLCSGNRTATLYGGDIVYISGVATKYECILAHTSSATRKPGSGASWTTYWRQTSTTLAGTVWATGTAYKSPVDLLIDCGVDKPRGSKVLSSEYIPPSCASYTEVTVLTNVYPYLSSPTVSALPTSAWAITFDNSFQAIKVSGGSNIAGAAYEDVVTFSVPGNMTSTITSGASGGESATHLVGTFAGRYTGDPFRTRYFNCYHSAYNPDSEKVASAGKTRVKITDGLPITPNLEAVSIVGT